MLSRTLLAKAFLCLFAQHHVLAFREFAGLFRKSILRTLFFKNEKSLSFSFPFDILRFFRL